MTTSTTKFHNWALQQLFIDVKEAYDPVMSELPNNIQTDRYTLLTTYVNKIFNGYPQQSSRE
jgi:hypothetical protein